jgi:peptidylprolyl isomerase
MLLTIYFNNCKIKKLLIKANIFLSHKVKYLCIHKYKPYFIQLRMNYKIKIPVFILILAGLLSCKAPSGNENTIILMKTNMGDIKLKLYDGTPIHRDNFVRLVKSGFYEGISFHRIIKDFMIQAGDPETKTGSSAALPDSLKTYTIPAEFNSQYFHKKGALAAAREGDDVNPQKRSSGTQFYIVQGVKYSDEELNQAEQRVNGSIKQSRFNTYIKETGDSLRQAGNPVNEAEIQQLASVKMFQFLSGYKDLKFPEEVRNIYKSLGGTPRLDGSYTVFGEVTEGIDIVDKIAGVQTGPGDKPVNDVKILKMKIVKN